jgi:hypothetical protein
LAETTSTKIDIHANEEHAFCYTCAHGYLDVAKWLYSIADATKIDIHTRDEYAFNYACANGHLEIAK